MFMNELINFREKIDEIDEKIVGYIKERLEICKAVAEYKSQNDIPMMQPGRVQEVLNKRRELADRLSINPNLVENIYKLIVDEACILEDKIIDALKK
jgi:chorismate mutase-like protein